MHDLSPQDLIDLIGAAGSLGGRLHMMTRAFSNQLEPRHPAMSSLSPKALLEGPGRSTWVYEAAGMPELPTSSLAQLCSHLGALSLGKGFRIACHAVHMRTVKCSDFEHPSIRVTVVLVAVMVTAMLVARVEVSKWLLAGAAAAAGGGGGRRGAGGAGGAGRAGVGSSSSTSSRSSCRAFLVVALIGQGTCFRSVSRRPSSTCSPNG